MPLYLHIRLLSERKQKARSGHQGGVDLLILFMLLIPEGLNMNPESSSSEYRASSVANLAKREN